MPRPSSGVPIIRPGPLDTKKNPRYFFFNLNLSYFDVKWSVRRSRYHSKLVEKKKGKQKDNGKKGGGRRTNNTGESDDNIPEQLPCMVHHTQDLMPSLKAPEEKKRRADKKKRISEGKFLTFESGDTSNSKKRTALKQVFQYQLQTH